VQGVEGVASHQADAAHGGIHQQFPGGAVDDLRLHDAEPARSGYRFHLKQVTGNQALDKAEMRVPVPADDQVLSAHGGGL
jgi:hypothetical protein